mmetsp:Transcript_27237/g.45419  ORF Transcript_27237/g.45419 Transcript_27237/m.45419 type:complete len:141 (+) Transcript_27237:78-500(+)|eukprot:CAMPEP_0119013930 /NCGR_PEP_ID=MMETSP1176-20130426/9263_1 /TAXON_ID=265551 /ORGANISM="Synedropsis recta cf, Strain CCMP1620" /LENGTH=140 /DNA_ID=CAMNT_0006967059 /DNA_START=76 /DNA_END=498 /DNA_ORIENTATION=+
MAKSIRSKIKRKHRAEFRRTHGTVAHNKAMAIIQSKLKDAVNKGTMNSFDRIADQLDTDGDHMVDSTEVVKVVVDEIKVDGDDTVVQRGENKAPSSGRRISKRNKNKLSSKTAVARKEAHNLRMTKKFESRPKPKFFCEF